MNLGNVEKAKAFIEKSFISYVRHYGKDHIKTARVIRNMGHLYFMTGYLETAENFINQSAVIFQKHKHPELYASLEGLSELYMRKSLQAINKGNEQQAQIFKERAIDYLKKALEIAQKYFLGDSSHVIRIQSKLNTLERG